MLAAARDCFAAGGYDGTSVRTIAARAGVDAALVHHYFATKEKLFLEVVGAPADPEEVLADVVTGPREDMGANLVRALLRLWDGPSGPAALALLRSSVGGDRMVLLLREFLLARVLRRLVGALDHDGREAATRVALVASQMVGLVMTRYVLRIEPLASAGAQDLVAAVGPNVQRYLTGDVPLPREDVRE